MGQTIFNNVIDDAVYRWGSTINASEDVLQGIADGTSEGAGIKYSVEETTANYQQVEFTINNITYFHSRAGYKTNNQPIPLRLVIPNLEQNVDFTKGCFYFRQDVQYNTQIFEETQAFGGLGILNGFIWNYYRSPIGFMYLDTNNVLKTIQPDAVQRPSVTVSMHYWFGDYNEPYTFDNVWTDYIKECNTTVTATQRIFASELDARKYLKFDDETGDINNKGGGESVGVDREYKLYYYADIYKTQFSHRKPSSKIGREKFEFIVKMRDKDGNAINKYNRGVIGWVDDSNADGRKNLRFMKNTATNNYLYANVDGTKIENFDFTNAYTTYTKNFKPDDDIYYYYANIQTNMYIFDTLANAQNFLDGLNDKLIGILEDFSQIDNTTDTVMNDNDVASDTNMSNAYILSKVDLHLLARAFNVQVNNGNIVQSLFVGLSIYQNPIDCNIDLFGLPFEVSEFTDYTPETIDFNPIIGNTTPSTS